MLSTFSTLVELALFPPVYTHVFFGLLSGQSHVPAMEAFGNPVGFATRSGVLPCSSIGCIVLFRYALFRVDFQGFMCFTNINAGAIPHSQCYSERSHLKTRRCCVHRNTSTAVRLPRFSVCPNFKSHLLCTVRLMKYRMFNNTILNDGTVQGCNTNYTMVQCSNQYGGLFDEGSSTSWNATTYSALNTAAEAVSDQGSDLWGTDIVKINTTFSLPSFPIGIFRSDAPNSAGAGNMDTLGLGRNSTLLNVLSSVGVIASRTYGYFQGWTGAYAQYQTDGSLVLGGYDAAKVTGSNVTLPFAPSAACNNGYVITVTDIKMNLKNGSNPSIIGQSAGSSLKACIEPDFGPITLSEDIWWAFTNITGVGEIGRSLSPLNFFGMLIPAGGACVRTLPAQKSDR